jgi:beta propeller repeat protein
MRKRTVLYLLLLGLALRPCAGAVLHVPSEYPRIQTAIDASQTGDTVIVAPGIYYETINFGGKNIIVTGSDPNDPKIVGYTIINADDDGSPVTFENGETGEATLTGFTITGGIGTYNREFREDIRAFWGAGIYCANASPTITKNVIARNNGPLQIADQPNIQICYGGGIGCLYSSPTISNNIIRDNSAYVGGGIITYFSDAKIFNNLIHGNSGTVGGGVVLLGGTLNNNTIVANDASLMATGEEVAGNLYVVFDPTANRSHVFNNIVSDAVSHGGLLYTGDPSYGTLAFNNVWNNARGDYVTFNAEQTGFVFGGSADLTGTDGSISADPMFVDTFGRDYHLTLDSPCVNAGDPDYAPAAGETDIDGEDRIYAHRIDIGADEYVGYVKPVAKAGADQHVLSPMDMVTLDGTDSFFYDPCAPRLYQWTQVAGPNVVLDDPAAGRPSFAPEAYGEYVFELVVGDGMYLSQPDEVMVLVADNQPPVAHAGTEKLWPAPGTVVLDGSGSYDPDPPDRLTYTWRQTDGPPVVLENPTSAKPSFSVEGEGRYGFELTVSDGFDVSVPSQVYVATVAVTTDAQSFSVTPAVAGNLYHPDVSGRKVVFATGSFYYEWQIACADINADGVETFAQGGINMHPKIDGDWVAWTAGPPFAGTIGPECTGIVVRSLATGDQRTLRAWSNTSSYGHPAVSGNKVVWVRHLEIDKNVPDRWFNMPYDICGADIADLQRPAYFTVATGVGRRDPFAWQDPAGDFDSVVDLAGNLVVWEGGGDIYAADISDLENIRVVAVCDAPGRQYDPAVSGSIAVWTDQRSDSGDIYGADLSDLDAVRVFEVATAEGTQQQPAIDGPTVVYLDGDGSVGRLALASITRRHSVLNLDLPGLAGGMMPALDGVNVVWLAGLGAQAQGATLRFGYSIVDGPIENLQAQKRYDYIQHAVADAGAGDEILLDPGRYAERVDFLGQAVTVRSTDPDDAAVVAATIIQTQGDLVTFANGEEATSVLDGLTLAGGANGVVCYDTTPIVKRCVVTGNRGDGLRLIGQSDPTITRCTIAANRGSGIALSRVEQGRFVHFSRVTVENCIIAANHGAGISSGRPTITNCTVTENLGAGIAGTQPIVTNSIVYFNDSDGDRVQIDSGYANVTYSDVQGGWQGEGNIDLDPAFVVLGRWMSATGGRLPVDPTAPHARWTPGDYHLKSQGWRWNVASGEWVSDDMTSPCIDAGDPTSPLADELLAAPDAATGAVLNERINMGAYGGTSQASLAPIGD